MGNNNNNNNQQQYKKSGATYTKIAKGNYIGGTIVNAWNVSKNRGLLKCTVAPYSGTHIYTNSKGQEKQTMIAIVTYANSGVEKKIPCSMNVKTRVIVLDELSMCITPNGSGTTKNGKRVTGYFGTNQRR